MRFYHKQIIFFHPSKYLFFIIILMTIIIIISVNSWFSLWFVMEINLISFIPLLIEKKRKYNSESSMKYFLIQTIASILIITPLLIININYLSQSILIIALRIKLAVAPLHKWILTISDNINWKILLILLTLQKINPLILYFYLIKNNYILNEILIFSCAFIRATAALNQNSLRKLIIYSSIAQISWILRALIINLQISISYYLVYIIIFRSVIIFFYVNKINTINNLINNKKIITLITIVSLISLRGLPPLTGFLPKIIIITEIIKNNNYIIIVILIFSTFITILFYMRINITIICYYFSLNNVFKKKNNDNMKINWINLVIIIFPPLFI